jgi:hypothetical protein
MKNFMALFVTTFAVLSSANATLVCSGWNQKHKPVVLRIEQAGENSKGYKLVDVKKAGFKVSDSIDMGQPQPKTLDGCEGALLAGEKNGQLIQELDGDLYIECAGDGDAGYIKLKKNGKKTYTGKFFAPNGKPALGLGDESEMDLNCNLK